MDILNDIKQQHKNLDNATKPRINYDPLEYHDDEPIIIQDMHGNDLYEIHDSKSQYEEYYKRKPVKLTGMILDAEKSIIREV